MDYSWGYGSMDVKNVKIESEAAGNRAEEYRETPGRDLNEMAEKELQALKLWLFGENIRLQAEQKKLLEMQNRFLKERMQFQEEMKMLNQKVTASRQRLRQDEQFFEKKMDILKSGFSQLEADRKAFEREKEEFRAEKKSAPRVLSETVEVFFAGVKNQLALKKRYKDLLKIYHPDNLAGDKAIMQEISKEYEYMKKMM